MAGVPILLVDGTQLAWRAACGFPARIRSRSGTDITAVFGFFALLRKTHRELWPGSEIIVCFDSEIAPNPRRTDYVEYKPWRPEPRAAMTPFEWLPAIMAGLDLLSIQWSEATRYEADDDIATLAEVADGRRVAVMSADHDFIQLVDRRVRLITPRTTFTVSTVIERFAVHPRQWCDYRALTGDPSDNIPGVRGVGPKRAALVLHRGRVLETARIPETWWGRLLRAEQPTAVGWRNLLRLRTDQDVATGPADRRTKELPKAADICDALCLWD